MKVVNGHVCLTGCDEAAARRGADPRNPTKDPAKQALLDEADALKRGEPAEPKASVLYGGRVADIRGVAAPGEIAARPPGPLGTRLDVTV